MSITGKQIQNTAQTKNVRVKNNNDSECSTSTHPEKPKHVYKSTQLTSSHPKPFYPEKNPVPIHL